MGFNYGTNGDNLPSPTQAVALLKSLGITQVRIYDTDPAVVDAFKDSNIQLVIGILNSELLQVGATNTSAAEWVTTKIAPYANSTDIYAIAVGNEVLTGYPNASSLLVPAMNNIYSALAASNLQNIKVSSPCSMDLLAASFFPSAGQFNGSHAEIPALLDFLSRTFSPYMVNVYPWKAFTAQPTVISLDYALSNMNGTNGTVVDPGSNSTYTSLFDAQLDAVYAALGRSNHSDLMVVVSETGWPTAGDTGEAGASIPNAQTYNSNLVKRVVNNVGTPARPGIVINAFLYELFNENQNVGPTSQRNFGVFTNDSTPLYALNLVGTNNTSGSGVGQRSWCIAKQGMSEVVLQTALDFACGATGMVDCTPIQPNGTCFLPDTRYSHASWAMNMFYANSSDGAASCNFQGAGRITTSDPSYGSCVYPASTSTTVSSDQKSKLVLSSAPLLCQLSFLLLAMSLWR